MYEKTEQGLPTGDLGRLMLGLLVNLVHFEQAVVGQAMMLEMAPDVFHRVSAPSEGAFSSGRADSSAAAQDSLLGILPPISALNARLPSAPCAAAHQSTAGVQRQQHTGAAHQRKTRCHDLYTRSSVHDGPPSSVDCAARLSIPAASTSPRGTPTVRSKSLSDVAAFAQT